MEVKLENLIEKIKKDGVEQARETSEEILTNAKKESALIIEQSKKDADKIIEDAKRQASQFQQNSELAVKQAARDTELLVKERLTTLFDQVFKKEVGNTISPDFMKTMILKIIEKWQNNPEVEITVTENDKKQLEKILFSGLKKELEKKINLKTSTSLTKGFQIGLKDGQVYYDFSDESIAEVLKSFLNPRIQEIMDQKNG